MTRANDFVSCSVAFVCSIAFVWTVGETAAFAADDGATEKNDPPFMANTATEQEPLTDPKEILKKYGIDPAQIPKSKIKSIPAKDMKTLPKVPPDLSLEVSLAHRPFVQGQCDICHAKNDLKDPGPIKKSQSNICFSCHVELLVQMSTARHLHEPFQKNCQFCHNPHNTANKSLLISSTAEVCLSCHEDIRKQIQANSVQHGAVTAKNGCPNCHDPHGSAVNKYLKNLPYFLCISCHSVDEIKDKNGNKMMNFEKHFAENKNRHAPVENKECSLCHRPHGSMNRRILYRNYTGEFYALYAKHHFELCYTCHPERIIEEDPTSFTGFRDEDKNVHYSHVISQEEKGRACHVCHAVHASNQPFHIRESVPFDGADWELSINFEPKPFGGSCVKTCHEANEYSRGKRTVEEPPRIRLKTAVDLQGRRVRLLSKKLTTVLLFYRAEQPYSLFTLKELEQCTGKLAENNVQIVGVLAETSDKSATRTLLNENSIKLPTIHDRKGQLGKQLDIKMNPLFIILDKEGHLLGKQIISKVDICRQLAKKIELVQGRISQEEYNQALIPPSTKADKHTDVTERYIGLATILLKRQLYKEAEEAIRTALQHDPSSGVAHALLKAVRSGQGDRPQLEVGKIESSVTIDGIHKEYAQAESLSFRAGSAIVSFRFLWSPSSLFAAVHVEDPMLVASEVVQGAVKGDSIELFLDPAHDQTPRINTDDQQFILTADQKMFQRKNSVEVPPVADAIPAEEIKYTVLVQGTTDDDKQDSGYDIEMSIPWTILGTTGKTGTILGVDLVLNDVLNKQLFSANWSGIAGKQIPANWNELVLVEQVEPIPSITDTLPGRGSSEATPPESSAPEGTEKTKGGCSCLVGSQTQKVSLWQALKALLNE